MRTSVVQCITSQGSRAPKAGTTRIDVDCACMQDKTLLVSPPANLGASPFQPKNQESVMYHVGTREYYLSTDFAPSSSLHAASPMAPMVCPMAVSPEGAIASVSNPLRATLAARCDRAGLRISLRRRAAASAGHSS